MHPPLRFRGGLLALALVAALAASAPAVDAQDAQRVVRSWVDDVKLDDGTTARWTVTLTYDAATGQYARTVTDASGALVERTVLPPSLMAPNAEELERAKAIILADPELRALYDQASEPTISGGFVLLREEGHPCGPGSRCLQFDVYDVDHAARRVDRIRYVVVDLRTGTLVSRNFDPSANGNETRFNRDGRTDAR
ncbi:MAG TPA: hypothetical protein VK002_14845 [Rubricoccaceae bacterium]|jgi:hypothetical protein|nr:hypothetical protein [Rubricoccaceae bacterium]